MLVLIFVVSMMFLIISPNVISILLGWDGLGLVSYLLVIYYQNVRSYVNATKAKREEEVQIHSFLIALLDEMSGQLRPTPAHSETKALK